jgi:hypothetical protein
MVAHYPSGERGAIQEDSVPAAWEIGLEIAYATKSMRMMRLRRPVVAKSRRFILARGLQGEMRPNLWNGGPEESTHDFGETRKETSDRQCGELDGIFDLWIGWNGAVGVLAAGVCVGAERSVREDRTRLGHCGVLRGPGEGRGGWQAAASPSGGGIGFGKRQGKRSVGAEGGLDWDLVAGMDEECGVTQTGTCQDSIDRAEMVRSMLRPYGT